MSLKDRLQRINEQFKKDAPAEVLATLHASVQELERRRLAERAPKEGDPLPDFALPDSRGRIVSSRDVLAEGPAVLTFFRGHWWPYCNAELDALHRVQKDFEAAGARLLAVSPNRAELSRDLIEKKKYGFEILHDKGNAVATRFGLVFEVPPDVQEIYKGFGIDLDAFNGPSADGGAGWTLPMPARFVADRDGVIRYARVSADYTDRPEPEETVDALRAL